MHLPSFILTFILLAEGKTIIREYVKCTPDTNAHANTLKWSRIAATLTLTLSLSYRYQKSINCIMEAKWRKPRQNLNARRSRHELLVVRIIICYQVYGFNRAKGWRRLCKWMWVQFRTELQSMYVCVCMTDRI